MQRFVPDFAQIVKPLQQMVKQSFQFKWTDLGKCCSPSERSKFISLFRQYKDVFAWTYEDLKTYDTKIIQHVIPIKVGVKPYQQPLRKMHPKLEPLIQSEVKNILDAKITFKVRNLEWVSNLVPV